jgi:D-inositol-3-phosphate glycosyltransferase
MIPQEEVPHMPVEQHKSFAVAVFGRWAIDLATSETNKCPRGRVFARKPIPNECSVMHSQSNSTVEQHSANEAELQKQTTLHLSQALELALLTGCQDRHYAFGLATALVSKGVYVDIIGSDEIDSPELHATPNLRFLNFRNGQSKNATFGQKVWKLLVYYSKLFRYVTRSKPEILHVLWNYKLEFFDRTILMAYYKALGKKVVLTAHNVNQARRDGKDSWLNRSTLKIQYRMCDHIFVHTQNMKNELCATFGVAEQAVTVIRYPVNNAFPDTELMPKAAKRRLGLKDDERAILFFGRIVPYKGIEYLLDAVRLVLDKQSGYRLIIAGEPKKGDEEYVARIRSSLTRMFDEEQILLTAQFIADRDLELYFKAADVLVLPYKEIFQSGILFLSYSFGLPAIATDVGSFREDILEGSTGFLCKPGDPTDMARAVERYFASDLYKNLNVRRQELKDYANANHSWHAAAELTYNAYREISGKTAS